MASEDSEATKSPEASCGLIWDCLKTAMSSLACGKAFFFDPRGDLTLEVGGAETGGTHEFIVCSRSLARSSSVFKAMLFDGFTESKHYGTVTWTVKLPQDHPAPVFLLLNLVHGHFTTTPQTLKLDELYQLLVVTEKYDITQALHPLARIWLQPYKSFSSVAGKEILMWIAWEIGHEQTFRNMVLGLVLNSPVDSDGQLLSSNGIPLSAHACLEPAGILEGIAGVRLDIIQKISLMLHQAIRASLENRACSAKTYSNYHANGNSIFLGSAECNAIIIGGLMQFTELVGLQRVGLLQTTTAPRYLGSVNDLLSSIQNANFRGHPLHPVCNPLPGIKTRIRELVQAVTSPVSDTHLEYLRKQAKKTGVDGKRSLKNKAKQRSYKKSRID